MTFQHADFHTLKVKEKPASKDEHLLKYGIRNAIFHYINQIFPPYKQTDFLNLVRRIKNPNKCMPAHFLQKGKFLSRSIPL